VKVVVKRALVAKVLLKWNKKAKRFKIKKVAKKFATFFFHILFGINTFMSI